MKKSQPIIDPVRGYLRPQELANTGEAIHLSLGGERGTMADRRAKLGNGLTVIVSDHSPTNTWSPIYLQLGIGTTGSEVVMRVVDGRSGSDDPDQDFTIRNNEDGTKWDYGNELHGDTRPEWVNGFLETLQIAQTELVS